MLTFKPAKIGGRRPPGFLKAMRRKKGWLGDCKKSIFRRRKRDGFFADF